MRPGWGTCTRPGPPVIWACPVGGVGLGASPPGFTQPGVVSFLLFTANAALPGIGIPTPRTPTREETPGSHSTQQPQAPYFSSVGVVLRGRCLMLFLESAPSVSALPKNSYATHTSSTLRLPSNRSPLVFLFPSIDVWIPLRPAAQKACTFMCEYVRQRACTHERLRGCACTFTLMVALVRPLVACITSTCMNACMPACVLACMCMHARGRACVHACVHACVRTVYALRCTHETQQASEREDHLCACVHVWVRACMWACVHALPTRES